MKKIIVLFLLVINSCSYPEMIRNEIVYFNDFENTKLQNIDGGAISLFNNSNVIGNFNNDGFTLFLEDIGEHDYISVSFDLYIHGSWDGNFNGFENNDKPDKWTMQINPEMYLYNDESNNFSTTFSNSPCWPNYCLKQSYPNGYPDDFNPRTGSIEVDLESVCYNNFFGGKTTLYSIEKLFKSSGNSVVIRFFDELYQPNAIDENGISQQKCDESWSMDNITVRAIKYE